MFWVLEYLTFAIKNKNKTEIHFLFQESLTLKALI